MVEDPVAAFVVGSTALALVAASSFRRLDGVSLRHGLHGNYPRLHYLWI